MFNWARISNHEGIGPYQAQEEWSKQKKSLQEEQQIGFDNLMRTRRSKNFRTLWPQKTCTSPWIVISSGFLASISMRMTRVLKVFWLPLPSWRKSVGWRFWPTKESDRLLTSGEIVEIVMYINKVQILEGEFPFSFYLVCYILITNRDLFVGMSQSDFVGNTHFRGERENRKNKSLVVK